MKKFKILVKNRFLNNEEMDNLCGGNTTCSKSSPYSNCQGFPPTHYTSCSAQAMPIGYETDGSAVLCGMDMQYGDSTCMGLGWWSTTCGSGKFYGGGSG